MSAHIQSIENGLQAEIRDGVLSVYGSYVDFAGELQELSISSAAIEKLSEALFAIHQTLVESHSDADISLTLGPNRGEVYELEFFHP